MSPAGETRQDKRKLAEVPMKRFSSKPGGAKCSAPDRTLTRHNPHVPLPPHAVSTMIPALRAQANTEEPSLQSMVRCAGSNTILGTNAFNLGRGTDAI